MDSGKFRRSAVRLPDKIDHACFRFVASFNRPDKLCHCWALRGISVDLVGFTTSVQQSTGAKTRKPTKHYCPQPEKSNCPNANLRVETGERHCQLGSGVHCCGGRISGIRLELKSEGGKLVQLEDADQFLSQTVQYTAGSDRRLGVLAILDCSPKTSAPGSVGNDILVNESADLDSIIKGNCGPVPLIGQFWTVATNAELPVTL